MKALQKVTDNTLPITLKICVSITVKVKIIPQVSLRVMKFIIFQ